MKSYTYFDQTMVTAHSQNVSPPLVHHPATLNDPELFLQVASSISRIFLSSGGSVSRLESLLVAAGNGLGYETTINATPSYVLIFCHDHDQKKTFSRGNRIHEFHIDLGKLRLVDKILNQLAAGSINPKRGFDKIKKLENKTFKEEPVMHYTCLTLMGVGAGLLVGHTLTEYLLAGAFTGLVQVVVRLVSHYKVLPDFFQDFLASLLAFFWSVAMSEYLHIQAGVLSLGTILYIVPGLQLTTAVTEIVDQNYLSGTIRFLKAFYIFLSMALAFYLCQDLLHYSGFEGLNKKIVFNENFFLKFLGANLIIGCASVKFRSHRKSHLRTIACGMFTSTTLFLGSSFMSGVGSTFFAAAVLGFSSFVLSRYFKHPSQIYSIPSMLILVPGMMAFSSVGFGREQVTSDVSAEPVLTAMVISLSIVFGMVVGRSLAQKMYNQPAGYQTI